MGIIRKDKIPTHGHVTSEVINCNCIKPIPWEEESILQSNEMLRYFDRKLLKAAEKFNPKNVSWHADQMFDWLDMFYGPAVQYHAFNQEKLFASVKSGSVGSRLQGERQKILNILGTLKGYREGFANAKADNRKVTLTKEFKDTLIKLVDAIDVSLTESEREFPKMLRNDGASQKQVHKTIMTSLSTAEASIVKIAAPMVTYSLAVWKGEGEADRWVNDMPKDVKDTLTEGMKHLFEENLPRIDGLINNIPFKPKLPTPRKPEVEPPAPAPKSPVKAAPPPPAPKPAPTPAPPPEKCCFGMCTKKPKPAPKAASMV